jgi:putative NADH-flavin reductase
MKILVIGAAGKSGRAVVDAALSVGHTVTALVRTIQDYDPAGVTVIEGDATDTADMERAVAGQDAVIDTIGGKVPWKSTGLERTAATAITSAMQKHEVRRFVVISMIGVGDSEANVPIYEKLLLPTLLRGERKDKEAMESTVRGSGLDWIIVRPPFLGNGPATGHIQIFDASLSEKAHSITRADLAAFLVAQVSSDEHLHSAVTIGNS